MPVDQPPDTGAVPTSSGRNRFANKRMFVLAGAVLAVVLLAVVYAVSITVAA